MRRHKSAAQPVQIVRQAAETARAAAPSVDLADVRDTVTVQAVRAAEAARDAAANLNLDEMRETVATEAARDLDLVIDETRRHPMRSLMIAMGLGVLVGMALDRMARHRKDEPPKSQWGPS